MTEQPKPAPKGTAKVRSSKFRHMFGTPFQNTECVSGIKLGATQGEASAIKASGLFFAVPWIISGSVTVIPINSKGAISSDSPVIALDENNINDFSWNPFENNLLATANQDGSVALWQIPEGGLTENLTTPASKIQASDKRLLVVDFHPTANNVLASVDAAKSVKIFDLESSQEKLAFPDVHKGVVTNLSWCNDGSLCATSCKDKTVRVFDPRANQCVAEAPDHPGAKGGRVVWLQKKDLIFTCGFGKTNERQIALYDPRKLGEKLTLQVIDSSSSSLMPFYDNDLGIMYLAGKGDGNIRYYEVTDEAPYLHYLNEFKSKDPQTGIAALPKQACDVKKCEVMRLLKLTPNGNVVPIRFEVPRTENAFFQEDLYPDTFDGKPSMSSDEWFSGSKNLPGSVSLNPEK